LCFYCPPLPLPTFLHGRFSVGGHLNGIGTTAAITFMLRFAPTRLHLPPTLPARRLCQHFRPHSASSFANSNLNIRHDERIAFTRAKHFPHAHCLYLSSLVLLATGFVKQTPRHAPWGCPRGLGNHLQLPQPTPSQAVPCRWANQRASSAASDTQHGPARPRAGSRAFAHSPAAHTTIHHQRLPHFIPRVCGAPPAPARCGMRNCWTGPLTAADALAPQPGTAAAPMTRPHLPRPHLPATPQPPHAALQSHAPSSTWVLLPRGGTHTTHCPTRFPDARNLSHGGFAAYLTSSICGTRRTFCNTSAGQACLDISLTS